MNDDELRSALERRVAAAPLSADDRNDLIRSARVRATQPPKRSILPRFAGWLTGATAIVVLALVIAPILLSPPSNSNQPPSTAIAVPTFPPNEGTPAPCPAALTEGQLVRHAQWGVALAPSTGGAVTKVVWPYGYSAKQAGDQLLLVDAQGSVVAHTGDTVRLGGGYIDGAWFQCGLLDVLATGLTASGIAFDPPIIHVSNATTLDVNLLLNGVPAGDYAPGTTQTVDPRAYGSGPWHLAAQTIGGRELLAFDVDQANIWHTTHQEGSESAGVGARADLSCGRLDVWAGPPMLGPPPPESFPPGDCEVGLPSPTASPASSAVSIPTASPWPGSPPHPCPAALFTGRLVADPSWGVALAVGSEVRKAIWPYGYSARPDGDRIALLDETGAVVAYTGDFVSIGGGDLPDGSFNACGGVQRLESSSPAPTASPIALLNQPLREGDRVRALGVVRGSDADGLQICESGGTLTLGHLQPTPQVTPACPPEVGVRLTGVSVASLPGWSPVGGGGESSYVEIRGTWTGGAIAVDSVQSAAQVSIVHPGLPAGCDAPSAGWPGEVPASIDGESALRGLQEAVDADPNSLIGYWAAQVDPTASDSTVVMVVGVGGDVAAARGDLEAVYPYNLCVVPVDYSAADLDAVAKSLEPATITWQPSVDEATDRVRVAVPYVDDAALSRVAEFGDTVLFNPVVTKVETQ